MDHKLLPCPFCGDPPYARTSGANPWAKCRTDGCMGGRLPSINLDHQPDIDAWNSRAEITRLRADLETVKHQLNSAMLALVSKDGHMSVLLEQRDQWIEARETLESERAANARLTADLDASQAECERLSKALRYEEHRASHIGTHGSDCYKWGPSHYECAVREIERLRDDVDSHIQITTDTVQECERLRADAERLDFVLSNDAFLVRKHTDSGVMSYQLLQQDHDEEYHALSGPGWFPSERAAIDAAISGKERE